MRCANCGNEDENTLWDEGDTIYCSRCAHRTRTSDGEEDLVECPHCHEMRDSKPSLHLLKPLFLFGLIMIYQKVLRKL